MSNEIKHNAEIYALTPREDLKDTNYKIYEKYLSKIFEIDNLCNIAISGSYGIGKTSILHTYCKNTNKRFLYLSLIDFLGNPTKDDFQAQSDKLEMTLFKQILCCCHKKDIPKLRFRVVPEEEEKWLFIFKSILFIIYVLILFCTVFSSSISELVHKLGFDFNGFGSIILNLLCIAGTVSLVGWFFCHFLRYGKLKELGVKNSYNNIEATVCLSVVEDSILEKFRFELVYAIEKMAKSYDAIVFEDMDRIDTKICISIFSQLREINISVNNRMLKSSEKRKNKSLRFLYVVDDELLGKINQTKFFDYILSVMPSLGIMNVKEKFAKMIIEELAIQLSNEERDTIYLAIEKCSTFADYRILNQIKNDFSVFKDIELSKTDISICKFKSDAALLAFIIYKVLCPGDYNLIRSNKSLFFPTLKAPFREFEWKARGGSYENYKAAYILATNDKPLLTASCLKFVGYSQLEQKEMYTKALHNDSISRKKSLLNSDTEICVKILTEESAKTNNNEEFNKMIKGIEDDIMLKYLECISLTNEDDRNNFIESQDEHIYGNFITNLIETLKKLDSSHDAIGYSFAVKYCVKCGYDEHNFAWFFTGNFDDVDKNRLENLFSDAIEEYMIIFKQCSQIDIFRCKQLFDKNTYLYKLLNELYLQKE